MKLEELLDEVLHYLNSSQNIMKSRNLGGGSDHVACIGKNGKIMWELDKEHWVPQKARKFLTS
jgi:hypothetical protein